MNQLPHAMPTMAITQPSTTSVAPQSSVLQSVKPASSAPALATPTSPSNNMNSNAQAALMILLTAQMQSQTGEASILQNPQVVSILQSLVSQAGDHSKTNNQPESGELLNHPALSAIFNQQQQQQQQQQQGGMVDSSLLGARTAAILDAPKRPTLLGEAPSGFQAQNPPETASPTPPMVANNLNNLLNAQNLSQLLGSLTGNANQGNQNQQRPVLLGDAPTAQPNKRDAPPPVLGAGGTPPTAPGAPLLAFPPSNHGGQPHPGQLGGLAMPGQKSMTQPASSASGSFPGAQRQPEVNHYMAQALAAQQQAAALVGNPFLMAYQGMPPALQQATNPFLYGAPPIQPFGNAIAAQAPPTMYCVSSAPSTTLTQPNFAVGHPSAQAGSQPTFAMPQQPVPAVPGSQFLFQTPPSGNKRKVSIPPSPEDSPQGGYIGQHSQGIGGHYADSYWRSKAENAAKRQRF